jgi:CRISPR-associated protein Csb2
LACFPLPHVGHPHADGQILGLAIALPRHLSDDEIDRAFRGVVYAADPMADPPELRLTLGHAGDLTLELEDRPARPVALRPETWTADLDPDAEPALRWATVTPIAFDRHPRGADPWPEIEASIRAATQRIGLAELLESVALSPVSPFAGAPTNRGFPNLQRKAGGNVHHTHALLTFRSPVVGPVLLGAGRYRGYGLCRPLRTSDLTA